MYRLELGVDPGNKQELLDAVQKDMTVRHGDPAAKRRVAAYNRAQRAWEKQVAAEERAAARLTTEDGEVIPVDPWAAEADEEDEEET
jgi:hypothetical protein